MRSGAESGSARKVMRSSLTGPRFYGLPPNEERITLQAKPLDVPERIEVPGGNKSIVVFRPDTPVGWSF